MNKVKKEIGKWALVLVRSCRSAGVATGDGRHLAVRLHLPNLDEGSALRCASVLRTPSAPAGKGRCAPTGNDKSCPSSLGPNRASGGFGRRTRLPNSPGGHPRPPRGTRIPSGSPASPPCRLPAPATKGSAPGPLGGARFSPGPRLRRPAFPSPSDQRGNPFGNPKRIYQHQ